MALKSAGNTTVSYNSNALTGNLNTQSIAAVVNAIDTTVFSSTGTQSIAGLPTWTVSVGGSWDVTLDGYLAPDLIAPPTTLRTLAVGISTVTYTWTAGAFISDYTIDTSSPTDGIMWSGTLTCSGVPVRS